MRERGEGAEGQGGAEGWVRGQPEGLLPRGHSGVRAKAARTPLAAKRPLTWSLASRGRSGSGGSVSPPREMALQRGRPAPPPLRAGWERPAPLRLRGRWSSLDWPPAAPPAGARVRPSGRGVPAASSWAPRRRAQRVTRSACPRGARPGCGRGPASCGPRPAPSGWCPPERGWGGWAGTRSPGRRGSTGFRGRCSCSATSAENPDEPSRHPSGSSWGKRKRSRTKASSQLRPIESESLGGWVGGGGGVPRL